MTIDLKTAALAVNLHGRRIGVITRLYGEKQIFAFEDDYIDDTNRHTLSLSYKGRSGGLVTSFQPISRRVPSFFSNLLPEGHLRTYLAGLAGVSPEREFYLLAALGADLAGAVTVIPLDRSGGEHPPIDEDRDDKRASGSTGVLRFSLAGVQLKFSAIMESTGGLTIPAHGIGGSWIVKLPSQRFEAVSENEFVMLELARSAGITVPPVRLVPVNTIEGLPPDAARLAGNALAVERFDRGPDGTRIHMEDFAQVFGVFPENKYKSVSYANIARVLLAETGERGAHEFIRRLVFSVLTGNADMHLKNWSLLYPDNRTAVLSPAYDFVSTLPYLPGDQLALTLGGSRGMGEISLDQIRRLTETAGLPMLPIARLVGETVESTIEAWRILEHKDLLPANLHTAIGTQIEQAAANTARSIR